MSHQEQGPISPATTPAVSVVITSWNGRHLLEQCLPTVAAQVYPAFEIIVVDNGSTDGTVAWLEAEWPQVRIIQLEQNLGFAAANNAGIRASRYPFVATLNNDTRVDRHWLSELVRAAGTPGVGMVASCVLRWHKPDMIDSAGLYVDVTGTAWNRGWGRPASSAATAGDVFGPSAAAALYCRRMLDEVGLFDETYFAYYEDVDLAWRARKVGWRCRYAPAARVWHWHSATGEQTPDLKLFLLGRNKIWTILKNYELKFLLPALLLVVATDLLAVLYQTVRRRTLAPLRGRISGWRQAPQLLSKRIAVHK